MRHIRVPVAVLPALALATALMVPAAGGRAVAAPPTIVSRSSKAAVPLPAPGQVVVQTIKLTTGTWTVMAKATAINPGNGDFFRCELFDATHAIALDGATTYLNAAVPRDVISNLAVLKVKGAVSVVQECSHDGDAGDSGSIDAAASLVGFVTPPARVRIARSTTSTNLSGTPAAVVSLSLPKGTWVLAVKITPVALSTADAYSQCSYSSASGSFDRELGTGSADHPVSTIFRVDATPKLSATTTLTVSCIADPGVYIDPSAVFWAWRTTDLQLTDSNLCPLTIAGTAAADAILFHQRGCEIRAGSFSSEFVSADLTAGNWVAVGEVDGLFSRGPDNTVQCQLLDADHGKQLDVSSAANGPAIAGASTGLTNLTVVKVQKTRTMEANCGVGTGGPTAASSDSGWAFIRP